MDQICAIFFRKQEKQENEIWGAVHKTRGARTRSVKMGTSDGEPMIAWHSTCTAKQLATQTQVDWNIGRKQENEICWAGKRCVEMETSDGEPMIAWNLTCIAKHSGQSCEILFSNMRQNLAQSFGRLVFDGHYQYIDKSSLDKFIIRNVNAWFNLVGVTAAHRFDPMSFVKSNHFHPTAGYLFRFPTFFKSSEMLPRGQIYLILLR